MGASCGRRGEKVGCEKNDTATIIASSPGINGWKCSTRSVAGNSFATCSNAQLIGPH
jgi:hypothetical protein